MTYKYSYILLIIGLMLAAITVAFSTDATSNYQREDLDVRSFSESRWEKLKKGIDYTEIPSRPEEEAIEEVPASEEDNYTFEEPVERQNREGLQGISIFLLIAAILALVALLVYYFINGNDFSVPKRNSTSEGLEIAVEQIEEDLNKYDPSDLLQQAIQNKDYRLAVRLYYLKALRELSQAGKIEWKRDKTNRIYIQELKGSELQPPFRAITSVFERIWYGNRAIDATQFSSLETELKAFLKTI